MEDLTKKDNTNQVRKEAKRLNLIDSHPKFKVGQIIAFTSGYNNDIRYKSEILGFDKDEDIYILWQCYWSPIRDEVVTNIEILHS